VIDEYLDTDFPTSGPDGGESTAFPPAASHHKEHALIGDFELPAGFLPSTATLQHSKKSSETTKTEPGASYTTRPTRAQGAQPPGALALDPRRRPHNPNASGSQPLCHRHTVSHPFAKDTSSRSTKSRRDREARSPGTRDFYYRNAG